MSDEQRPNQSGLVQSGNRGLIARSSTLVRRGLETLLARLTRVVHFPPDRSMGRLVVCGRERTRRQFNALFHGLEGHLFEEHYKLLYILQRGNIWNELDNDLHDMWGDRRNYREDLGEVRGAMTVPAAKPLHLRISAEAEADLSPLTTIPSSELRDISLSFSFWSERGAQIDMVNLGKLTALQVLDLSHSQLSDTALIHLRELTALQILDLSETEFNLDELVHLEGLTGLQDLDLSTKLQDQDLSNGGYFFDEARLVHIKKLTGLKVLRLGGREIGDVGLVHLKGIQALQALGLSRNSISNAGLVHLSEHLALKLLDLSSNNLNDAGLVHLQKLVGLERLSLCCTRVNGSGLAFLRELRALRELYLSECEEFDAANLVYLKELIALQRLVLSGLGVADARLMHLTGLTTLQQLDLSHNNISDAGLGCLSDLKALQEMNLSKTDISDTGLSYLKGLTALRVLDVSKTKITDAGVAELKRALPNCYIKNDPPARVFHFPLDRSVGRLYYRLAWPRKWEEFGEARGNCVVRGDWEIWLSVYSEAAAALFFLTALKKDDSFSLGLSCTRVSDTQLVFLRGLVGLRELSLASTQISDAGLTYLRELAGLKALDLSDTRVSEVGISGLQRALPDCRIKR